MKLLLINPNNAFQKFPPLNLAIIASLTPPDWDVKIYDLNFEKFEFTPADLVGITSLTCTANIAYEIAAVYKNHNIKVIMGGIHASILPEEALRFVDSVVVGEAEGIWKNVIDDFTNGELKTVYNAPMLPFANWPVPRHDLFHPWYFFDVIQTSRGCPMRCDFCSVSMFNGQSYRQRPVEEVIAEMKTIKKDRFFIIDDNILGIGKKNEERALDLFRRMKEEKINKRWFSYASINFADNPEIIKAAAECGCKMIFIGFEAEDDKQLAEMHKGLNIKSGSHLYHHVVKKINKYKIAVMGGFIIGFDTDTRESIKKRKRFILKNRINTTGLAFLTPLPGTVHYNRLLKENRIIFNNYPHDWPKYNFLNVVYKPENFSAEELRKYYIDIIKAIYKKKNIIIRTLYMLWQSKSIEAAKYVYKQNYRIYAGYKRMIVKYAGKQKHNPDL